jgi:hypothetical protein
MTIPSPSLRFVTNEDGAAILDIEHDTITTLNPTGAFVWQQLKNGDSLDTIIVDLAHETGAEILVVDRDVRVFADQLKQTHVLPR